MQKISGKVLILGVVGVLIVVGLGYVMITKFGLLGVNHNTTQDLTPTINSYPFHQFDGIQLPQTIPVYPKSILVEKLEGKNEFNQDIQMFTFRTAGQADITSIDQYLIAELPKNNWQITSHKYNKCTATDFPCYDWLLITATQNNQTLEVTSNTGYEISIALSSGEQRQVTLRPPEGFPALLIPTSFQIAQFTQGFNEGERKISYVKLQNITETMLNDLMPELLKDSWEKETHCQLVGAEFICSGYKRKSHFAYEIYKTQYFGKDETVFRLTEKVVDDTLTDLQNGWMRYTNNEYGFSFEVPDFWSLESIDRNFENRGTEERLYISKGCPDLSSAQCNYIKIGIMTSSITGKGIEEWQEDLKTDAYIGAGSITEREKILVAGRDAWKIKLNFDGEYYLILIPDFEKNYMVNIYIISAQGFDSEIFQRILTTLKFN